MGEEAVAAAGREASVISCFLLKDRLMCDGVALPAPVAVLRRIGGLGPVITGMSFMPPSDRQPEPLS
jgi:hypothetical protein